LASGAALASSRFPFCLFRFAAPLRVFAFAGPPPPAELRATSARRAEVATTRAFGSKELGPGIVARVEDSQEAGRGVRIAPRGNGPAPLTFRRGAHAPFGIRWYGVTSLLGHLRHFVASAIASEQVDSRDWMRPEAPGELLLRIARVLRVREPSATLVESVGRPLWIDFVADTGDDRDVSAGVARMVASTFTVASGDGESGEERTLPRGDLLLFGGDTAYPVATADEIDRRVVRPWSEAIREVDPHHARRRRGEANRVLLGIPGNHDWYDGLDGFGRMFRKSVEPVRREESPRETAAERLGRLAARNTRPVGIAARQLHLDEVSGLFGLLANGARAVLAFFKGGTVTRRKRLQLPGYEAVQESSYWALPLSPGLEMWGVDRQLGRLDFRQRAFFQRQRAEGPNAAILFVAPDPAIAFGEPHGVGQKMLSGCKLSLSRDRLFYLTGDLHHYERRRTATALHVIAGGGGAFLHGTRIGPAPLGPPEVTYPTAGMSRQLLLQVPVKLMFGTSGLLVHLALAIIATLELASLRTEDGFDWTVGVLTSGLCLLLYMIAGHQRTHPFRIALFSVPFGAALGVLPWLLRLSLPRVVPLYAGSGAVMVFYAMIGSFVFGLFLAVIAIAGLEPSQAFAVLGHPGFKHFVRLCVHPDARVEAWVIGKDDVLESGPPVIIDQFTWDPRVHEPRHGDEPRGAEITPASPAKAE
jgi:hypothetical protein